MPDEKRFPRQRSDILGSSASIIFQSAYTTMSNGATFRWRTVVEVAAISAVIYFLLGTPGLRGSSLTGKTSSSLEQTLQDEPVARAKSDRLVYPEPNLTCDRHDFEIHVFSTSPLVIYVDGFLSERETEHLIEVRYRIIAKLQPNDCNRIDLQ